MTLSDSKTFVLATLKERNKRENLVKLRLVLESSGTLQFCDEVPTEQLLRNTLVTEDGRFRRSAFSQPIQQWERDMAIQCGHFLPTVSLAETAEDPRNLTKLRLLRHYPLNLDVYELEALWIYLKRVTPAFFQELLAPLSEHEVALGQSEHWFIEPGHLNSEDARMARDNLNEVLQDAAMRVKETRDELFDTNGDKAMDVLAQVLRKWATCLPETADCVNRANLDEPGCDFQEQFTEWSLKYVWWELQAQNMMRVIDFWVDVALALDKSGLTADVRELYLGLDEWKMFCTGRLCERWKFNRPYNCISRSELALTEEGLTRRLLMTPAHYILRNPVCLEWDDDEAYAAAKRAMSEMSA